MLFSPEPQNVSKSTQSEVKEKCGGHPKTQGEENILFFEVFNAGTQSKKTRANVSKREDRISQSLNRR